MGFKAQILNLRYQNMNIECNGQHIEITQPMSLRELAIKMGLTESHQAVAVRVNGRLADFGEEAVEGDAIEFLDFQSEEGKEVFWHSSAHILAEAILNLFPEAKLTIGPPISQGFYYDFANLTFSENDFKAVEKEVQRILKRNDKPQKMTFKSRQEALERFKENPFKCELINDLPEDALLTGYTQGEFFDLCRGPHLPSTGKIKAFKLLKTSAAYWRADQARESLTRIYGISFPSKEEMKSYLHLLEEAKKRDHRMLGSKLNLFSFHEEAAGMPFFHPKGMVIWNQLISYWSMLHKGAGYVEIKTPGMLSSELWKISGHWDYYKENMYTCEVEEKTYAIKPMNCPGCMLYYKTDRHSYRELPMRVAEIGNVYRHELSGALSGMFRVRSFHQDDAHVFMRPGQIKGEILHILTLVDEIYTTFGLDYHLELSTRPKKSIGSDEVWELSTKALQEALDESKRDYVVNEGDGAFYGPKIDLHIRDALGRTWQCGTIQLDMSLPVRFDLEYTEQDGSLQRPIMTHRAIFGSIERFFGILIEHFGGRFPLWLSPTQVRIVTVADRHIDFAKKIQAKIMAAQLRCDLDDSGESVGKKIRTAQMEQINYMFTIGDQEVENEKLSLRTRSGKVIENLDLDAFIEKAVMENTERMLASPFEGE